MNEPIVIREHGKERKVTKYDALFRSHMAGQIIDLGGDFTALNERDFELAKQIVNKGRGKDVTPNG
jgi:hypothetical protein